MKWLLILLTPVGSEPLLQGHPHPLPEPSGLRGSGRAQVELVPRVVGAPARGHLDCRAGRRCPEQRKLAEIF